MGFVDKRTTATTASKAVPALIPLTVSEFGERPPVNSPSTLHMSGGGVYTTDSYYRKPGPTTSNTTASTTASGGRPAPQLSVIKKLPVSPPPAWMPTKKRTVIKSKTASAENNETTDNDHNQGSKRARNDLVIEKIPRKNTAKERTE